MYKEDVGRKKRNHEDIPLSEDTPFTRVAQKLLKGTFRELVVNTVTK